MVNSFDTVNSLDIPYARVNVKWNIFVLIP